MEMSCRMCAGVADPGVCLLDPTQHKIKACAEHNLAIQINADNGYPTRVCLLCLEQLRKWLMFRDRCKNAHNMFTSILKISPSKSIEPPSKSETLQRGSELNSKSVMLQSSKSDIVTKNTTQETKPNTMLDKWLIHKSKKSSLNKTIHQKSTNKIIPNTKSDLISKYSLKDLRIVLHRLKEEEILRNTKQSLNILDPTSSRNCVNPTSPSSGNTSPCLSIEASEIDFDDIPLSPSIEPSSPDIPSTNHRPCFDSDESANQDEDCDDVTANKEEAEFSDYAPSFPSSDAEGQSNTESSGDEEVFPTRHNPKRGGPKDDSSTLDLKLEIIYKPPRCLAANSKHVAKSLAKLKESLTDSTPKQLVASNRELLIELNKKLNSIPLKKHLRQSTLLQYVKHEPENKVTPKIEEVNEKIVPKEEDLKKIKSLLCYFNRTLPSRASRRIKKHHRKLIGPDEWSKLQQKYGSYIGCKNESDSSDSDEETEETKTEKDSDSDSDSE